MTWGSVVLGFDPGGAGAFGWAVLRVPPDGSPPDLTKTGVTDFARQAVDAALAASGTAEILAAGIDSPLWWSSHAHRTIDDDVRATVVGRGGQSGTVQQVNSLRGACIAQGLVCARILRQSTQERSRLPLTETHPKAALYYAGLANETRRSESVNLSDLAKRGWLRDAPSERVNEHTRDAVLSAIAAWAMLLRRPDWQDIADHQRELDPFLTLDPPPAYWMPILVT